MRGYAAIGLDRPKDKANLGGVLRAAECFCASLVVVGGDRMGKYATDVRKAYRHMPVIELPDIAKFCPFGAVPVVVELDSRAKDIRELTHPESCFYIFGPEDGSVQKTILESAPMVVSIPTKHCLNLAATVNVVLYDRLYKRGHK